MLIISRKTLCKNDTADASIKPAFIIIPGASEYHPNPAPTAIASLSENPISGPAIAAPMKVPTMVTNGKIKIRSPASLII